MKVGGPTRREVLRWTAFGTAGIVVAGCGDDQTLRPPGAAHAAAILEPESDSFLVAIWALIARAVGVVVRVVGDDDVVFSAFSMFDTHRAVFDVTGLDPDTHYEVTLDTDDGVRMVYRVRTAPRADATRPVRIAVSADIDPHPEFKSDLIEHVIDAEPELFVSLGDFPYTDNGPPAMDVSTYRERHAQARTEPRIRRLLERVGVRAIYDDHEFRNDWDGMYMLTEAPRYAAAMQVWDEFFPVRADDDIKYRSWRWGAHLECFLLDCRRFRSPNAVNDGPGKTMLGAQQRAWLVESVRASTATFKLVFSGVPLDFGDGNDHWSSFRYERDGILDALLGVSGLLFVSADQHWFASHQHAHGIREFQVGPLARGIGTPLTEAPGVLFRASRLNAALIDVSADALTFSGLGVGGEIFFAQTFSVADLTPASLARR